MNVAVPDLPGVGQEILGWVGALAREVAAAPWPVAAALAVLGAVQLAAGGRARRPIAVVGGAVVGVVAASAFGGPLADLTGLSGRALAGVAAAVAGGLCGAFPPLFPAAGGALPAALAAAVLAPEAHRPIAVGLGAVAGAAGGLVAARLVAAAVAAAIGAFALALGLAGALQHAGVGRALAAHPAALLAVAVVLAVAGAAFQLPSAWRRPSARAGPAEPADEP